MEHRGFGDKHCPKCDRENVVLWRSILLTKEDGLTIEIGRFYCTVCDWESELHETTLEDLGEFKANGGVNFQ